MTPVLGATVNEVRRREQIALSVPIVTHRSLYGRLDLPCVDLLTQVTDLLRTHNPFVVGSNPTGPTR